MGSADCIGVVTVTYNSGKVLQDFLRCMQAQTHRDFLLFAIDNDSRDCTLETLQAWSDDRLRITANAKNLGVACGNNQGILQAQQAGCSSILLLNNDTEFESVLLEQLHRGLDEHNVEMICPKVMYFDEPDRIWAAGGGFRSWLGYRSFHTGANERDRGQYDRARLISYVPTCCVLIRQSVFHRIGLMDERYFVYMDDVDFMYRAKRAGVKLLYQPESKVLHKVGALTGGDRSTFGIRITNRNLSYFLLKHFGAFRSLPLILLNHLVYILRVLSGSSSLAVYRVKFRATLDGFALWYGCRGAKERRCPP